MKWYLGVLKKYVVFGGRAQRMEYWMFNLFNYIIVIALAFIEVLAGIAPETDTYVLATVYSLAVLLPNWAVSVRRLHDTGRSGLWLLVGIVPLIGVIVLFIFYVMDSQPGENRYGPNPKEGVTA